MARSPILLRRTGSDIFISYDRDSDGGWSKLLSDSLARQLPSYGLFKDDHSLQPGDKWPGKLLRALRSCRVFLLVVSNNWNKAHLKDKLAAPDNWVHREILEVRSRSDCTIIPLLVDGAKVPSGLHPDINPVFDSQCFYFSVGTKRWGADIQRLCEHITQTSHDQRSDESLTRLFSGLDRITEVSRVRAIVPHGHCAVAIGGCTADEPSVFAYRCGEEILHDLNHGHRTESTFENPISLPWRPFSNQSKAHLRRRDLLRRICDSVSETRPATQRTGEDENDWRERVLNGFFRGNQQTQVFYTIAHGPRAQTKACVVEWLALWRALLDGSKNGNTVAFAFVPRRGWRAPSLPHPTHAVDSVEDLVHLQRSGLGPVRPDDLKVFLDTMEDDGRLSKAQRNATEHAARWLFWFGLRRGRRFANVKSVVQAVITG